MLLIDKLKQERNHYRVQKDLAKVELYGLVIGEVERLPHLKDRNVVMDQPVQRVLKGMVETEKANIKMYAVAGRTEAQAKSELFVQLFEKHLPVMMASSVVEDTVKRLYVMEGYTEIKQFQQYFAKHYQGQYNGAEVTKFANNLLRGN